MSEEDLRSTPGGQVVRTKTVSNACVNAVIECITFDRGACEEAGRICCI
jgi:hypothetical protein